MHISEGVLSPQIYLTGYAAAAGLTALAIKKTQKDDIPKISVMGAAFFVASLIHFKIGITSVHLTLIGLMGISLGLSCVPAILVGLFFQAVMFQHGGLTSLGVNTLVFSLPAICISFIFSGLSKRFHRKPNLLSVFGGVLTGFGIIAAALLVFLVIFISGEELTGIAYVFSIAHAVLAVVEGVITFFILQQLLRKKPELVSSFNGP
jgi:cobalt/nickel transport system permease protein